MKKLFIRFLSIILIMFTLLNITSLNILAFEDKVQYMKQDKLIEEEIVKEQRIAKQSGSGLSDIFSSGKNFLNAADGSVNIDEKEMKAISDVIYNILLMISFIVVIVVGIILGIIIMTSNAEKKAEAQKSLLIFVIGSTVVFGAFGIWKLVVTFLQSF